MGRLAFGGNSAASWAAARPGDASDIDTACGSISLCPDSSLLKPRLLHHGKCGRGRLNLRGESVVPTAVQPGS